MIIDEFTLEMLKIGFIHKLNTEIQMQATAKLLIYDKNFPASLESLGNAAKQHTQEIKYYQEQLDKQSPDIELGDLILNLTENGDIFATCDNLIETTDTVISLLKRNKMIVFQNIYAARQNENDVGAKLQEHMKDYIEVMEETRNYIVFFKERCIEEYKKMQSAAK